MKVSDVKKVCVAGGGQMGRQIALNAAIHGFDTYLTDAIADVLTAVDKWSAEYLEGRVAKGKLTAEQAADAKAKFHLVPTLQEAAEG
ncbi:3-hydroxyacyl-CoA dehydrogenase NAD-binding domain-containing protein, partial [Intestinimonas butyriciproducens]